MKKLIVLLTMAALTVSAQDKPLKRGTYAHFETSMGTFTAQLETQLAPKTVANFIGLARGTKDWRDPKTGQIVTGKPFYEDLVFHRVVGNFIIQSGDPTGTGTGGSGFTIPDEFSSQLRHDRAGILSMGNPGKPNSATSQFFVTLREAPELNGMNAAFGNIVRGMDVVRKIGGVRTRNDRPVTPVTLLKVRIEVVE
jgi:peptidyl-prolyl cis-trans isomerase A (cyclophilin A)